LDFLKIMWVVQNLC